MTVVAIPMIDVESFATRWYYHVGLERTDGSIDDLRRYWRFETLGL